MDLFEIVIDPLPTGDAQRDLQRQLKEAIVDGRLRPGTRLPSLRRSQQQLGVSRNMAASVYEALAGEGLVDARVGAGTFVAAASPRFDTSVPASAPIAIDRRLNGFWLRHDVHAALGFWQEAHEPTVPTRVDFRPALVDPELFPFDALRRASVTQWRALERKRGRMRSGYGNPGHFPLRDAIARHIAQTRAVVCDAAEVIVTSGAQQAFDLLARILVTPGQTVVAVEDPGYPPMRIAFAAAGARIVPVPVDAEGLVAERLPERVDVICLTPSHQFPLGVTMSTRRRAELLDLARRRGAVIVEDDYDGEFRHDPTPVSALRSPAAADVVFYVGTFSKCMLPSLRLGFLIAPAWARESLVAAKNGLDWHCSAPIQMAVAEFMRKGLLAQHVRRMRAIYLERRNALLARLERDFGSWLEPIASSYGMHVTAIARTSADGPIDTDAVSRALLDAGVRLHSLARYYLGAQTRTGWVFGLGAADLPRIEAGLDELQRQMRAHRKKPEL